jgi:hypothetical protein
MNDCLVRMSVSYVMNKMRKHIARTVREEWVNTDIKEQKDTGKSYVKCRENWKEEMQLIYQVEKIEKISGGIVFSWI